MSGTALRSLSSGDASAIAGVGAGVDEDEDAAAPN